MALLGESTELVCRAQCCNRGRLSDKLRHLCVACTCLVLTLDVLMISTLSDVLANALNNSVQQRDCFLVTQCSHLGESDVS